MRPDRDYLQLDCAMSYGLVEYQRSLDMLIHPADRQGAAFRAIAIRCS